MAAGASDRGRRYSRNEDALAIAAHSAGIAAVVSDGVGSSQRPEDASRTAAETGAAELVALLDAGEDPEAATRAAALRAAAAVAALATSPTDAPSCTYVSAVTRGTGITVGWIGDSRAYWLSADGSVESGEGEAAGEGEGEGQGGTPDPALPDEEVSTGDMAELGPSRRLTEDDSWAAFMVAEGSLTEAEAEAHPNAHVITAWLGADAGEVGPHVASFRPAGPGTLLVCSDGLWNYFPAAGDLAALLTAGPDDQAPPGGAAPGPGHDPSADPLGVARALVRHALDAGGRDNITVAVIPLPSPAAAPQSRIHEGTTQSTEQPR
ncbi:serine/threonine protein phosphatase [Actinomadura sp. KC216]|nr:serine/threonine protein phosphatase [Actinomadura sp. KC216]